MHSDSPAPRKLRNTIMVDRIDARWFIFSVASGVEKSIRADMLGQFSKRLSGYLNMRMKRGFLLLPVVGLLCACSGDDNSLSDAPTMGLDSLARDYLYLELSMVKHDPAHVDAYFGPEEIREAAVADALELSDIDRRAIELESSLLELPDGQSLQSARIDGLKRRLTALRTRIALQSGENISFDEESKRLFAATAPDYDAAHYQTILDDIDALLETTGDDLDLPARVAEFRNQFVIPPEKLGAVFDAAIAECRRRTLSHIELPEHESFTVEYVTDKPWSGYNWYQGDAISLIQINTDLPIFINRAVDLGCHEGYPGHHTFNTLLEEKLVDEEGWLEFSLYPLFSPQSLVAEGSGNYGIELAFPGNERIDFEVSVLFPLAGIDTTEAQRYYELQALLAKLNYAGNEAARDYLNNDISRDQAIEWLIKYSLSDPDRAKQRTEFFDAYRSYVINYNLGKDLVARYVEANGADQAERWRRFEALLSTPVTAADLNPGSSPGND